MPHIAVISTFAEDTCVYAETGGVIVKKGGPAFWITETLKTLGITFSLVTSEQQARVRITIEQGKEQGVLETLSPITASPPPKADAYIISTIGDEFNLSSVISCEGVIALDVQGYVRTALAAGEKMWIPPASLKASIALLKTTERELMHVDPHFVQDQKERIMIITKGERGFDLWTSGKLLTFQGKKINAPDAIGAGDVLFSAFTAFLLKTKNPADAGGRALIFAERFLRNKSISHAYKK